MFALTKTNATGTRFAIGSVERDTGIGRDTLRVWERRYGFPSPERNNKGERVYTADQSSTPSGYSWPRRCFGARVRRP